MVELKPGDWVKTESGEVGKVVHIDRLTVFVAFSTPVQPDRVFAFLKSALTETDPPDRRSSGSGYLPDR